MGDQPERVTIDGKEYVLASPNAVPKYQGLYSMGGKWYRIEDGQATVVPMSAWQRTSGAMKVLVIFGVLLGGLGLLALLVIADDDAPTYSDGGSTSSGADADTATVWLTGECESGSCRFYVSNDTSGSDVIEDAPELTERFTVSNEEYEIYSISVDDSQNGESSCRAVLSVDGDFVDRDEQTSNGTSAFCAVSTLIN